MCVNRDTQTHRPCTLPLHRYTPTHRHTPQHDHPCVPSGCHHTHTTNTVAHPRTKAAVPDTDTHTSTSPAHLLHSHTVSHTQEVSHICKGHKWSVVYPRHGAVSHTRCHSVTHPVSHSQCHPHTAPTPSASPTLPAKPFIAPGRHRATDSFTEPCRAEPSRNRAEPDRARPYRAEPCRAPPRPSTRPAAAELRRAHPIPSEARRAEPCRAVPLEPPGPGSAARRRLHGQGSPPDAVRSCSPSLLGGRAPALGFARLRLRFPARLLPPARPLGRARGAAAAGASAAHHRASGLGAPPRAGSRLRSR